MQLVCTEAKTNNLRVILIWDEPNNSECNGLIRTSACVLGDICASTVLILCTMQFILPLLSNPLSRKVLASLYVDDSLSAGRDKAKLLESVNEVLEKLEIFKLLPKYVLCNWLPPPLGRRDCDYRSSGMESEG